MHLVIVKTVLYSKGPKPARHTSQETKQMMLSCVAKKNQVSLVGLGWSWSINRKPLMNTRLIVFLIFLGSIYLSSLQRKGYMSLFGVKSNGSKKDMYLNVFI